MSLLPGYELVEPGLEDLRAGVLSTDALLVLIGAFRLRRAGVDVPGTFEVADPEGELYRRLSEVHGRAAHGLYLSLIRRLMSYESAVEAQSRRHQAAG